LHVVKNIIKKKLVECAKVGHGSLWVACAVTWLNRAAVSRNRYGVEKTVDTHKILINAIKFYVCLQEIWDKTMCEVLWRNISDFYVNLRVEVGKHPHVIITMNFYLGQE
jgi:hypothetical protein